MHELTEEEELLLHGHCHLLAIAMHEQTGLSLVAYVESDFETETTVLVHAFVLDGDHAIDIRGRIPLDDVLIDFVFFEPELIEISRDDLLLLGSGNQTPDPNDVDKAQSAAKSLMLRLRETLDVVDNMRLC